VASVRRIAELFASAGRGWSSPAGDRRKGRRKRRSSARRPSSCVADDRCVDERWAQLTGPRDAQELSQPPAELAAMPVTRRQPSRAPAKGDARVEITMRAAQAGH